MKAVGIRSPITVPATKPLIPRLVQCEPASDPAKEPGLEEASHAGQLDGKAPEAVETPPQGRVFRHDHRRKARACLHEEHRAAEGSSARRGTPRTSEGACGTKGGKGPPVETCLESDRCPSTSRTSAKRTRERSSPG